MLCADSGGGSFCNRTASRGVVDDDAVLWSVRAASALLGEAISCGDVGRAVTFQRVALVLHRAPCPHQQLAMRTLGTVQRVDVQDVMGFGYRRCYQYQT
jgi:hypothetical protein